MRRETMPVEVGRSGGRGRVLWLLLLLVLAPALLLGAGPAGARLRAPVPLAPAAGTTTDGVPAFAWKSVAAATTYEFQIAADSGFNSPVLGRGQDDFVTRNTRATLKKALPNGTYWWRVRAISGDDVDSPWSAGRSIKKLWAATTHLQSPVGGTAVVYPTTPLKLSWSPVAGARKYLVSIAYDRALGSLVPGSGRGPIETTANTLTRAAALAPGTYYWGVTPVDAEGNRGVASSVASFKWVWPSTTTARVADLDSSAEVYDPQFSWARVAGAARYEVEINSSSDFAPGSRVCCTPTTIATSLSPTTVLKNNTYYWRVRAIDLDGNAGAWNIGPPFAKTFDNAPPMAAPTIKNLHMRDNLADPGGDVDGALGYQTDVPLIAWNPVPGASSYDVEVTRYDESIATPACNWSANAAQGHWHSTTAVTAWTPLGTGWNGVKPFDSTHTVATDIPGLTAGGKYCVRVRARSDRVGADDGFLGDYTYLSTSGGGWAFEWAGPAPGGSCAPTCSAGYLGAANYGAPTTGSITRTTPYFTWQPMAGATSYFVVVAKDPSFTTIVDYAFTQLPAYAPRTSFQPTTYADETTRYYWAVLPAADANGNHAVGDPLAAAPASFQKQSIPPALVTPADGSAFSNPPTFRWSGTQGARRYRLQVAQDPSFGTLIDNVVTDSTAFTSNTTYPSDTLLYWRVRADDENLVGLNWSVARTFQKRLPMPQLRADNPAGGDFIPSWSWMPVDGAVAYDVAVDLPNGTHRDINGLRTPVLTPVLMYGTGVFSWRVRAEFPQSPSGVTPGPYTSTHTFVRTIGEPAGAPTDAGVDHVLLSWSPKAGVKGYVVQLSARPTFLHLLESATTDNTSYAPSLKFTPVAGLDTGHFYWRVAAVDEGNNVGDFTPVQTVTRTRRMTIALSGKVRRKRNGRVTVRVTNFESGAAVAGVTVRVSGAGVRARRVRTSANGTVVVKLRPRRRATIQFRASARGYQRAQAGLRVR
jgi:hypothetical protein